MGVWATPARLLELAGQSLLQNEALAIAALEELPVELFPPLFTAAFAGRHTHAVKAMVQAWPFACLPLGALMKDHREVRSPCAWRGGARPGSRVTGGSNSCPSSQ